MVSPSSSRCQLLKSKRCILLLLFTLLIQILIFYKIMHNRSKHKHKPIPTFFFEEKWNFTTPNAPLPKLSPIYKHQEFLVFLRNLGLFSIWSINKKIKGYKECNQWWMNPLLIRTLESTKEINGSTFHQLTFGAQPGRTLFRTIIQIRKYPPNDTHPYLSQDIRFIHGNKVNNSIRNCGNVKDHRIRVMCSCWTDKEKEKAEIRTKKIRQVWNKIHPEEKHWPLDISTMVGDYLTFGPKDYHTIPRKPNWLETEEGGYCGVDVKILILITCTPSNFNRRQSVRTTFGNPEFLRKYSARVVFAFGISLNVELEKKIEEEQKEYGDILQGNYIEGYKNLTLRILNSFNWIVNECENSTMPPLILKADDDYFLNIPLALKIGSLNPNALIIGEKYCNTERVRSINSKHYTPTYMHISNYYPDYLTGGTALIQSKILPPLLQASIYTPIIKADDVYFFGILPSEIGIKPFDSGLIYVTEYTGVGRLTQRRCWSKAFVNTWAANDAEMKIHWENFNNDNNKACNKFIRRAEFHHLLTANSNCLPKKRRLSHIAKVQWL